MQMSFGRRLRTLLLSVQECVPIGTRLRLLRDGWIKMAADRDSWDGLICCYCGICRSTITPMASTKSPARWWSWGKGDMGLHIRISQKLMRT